MAGLDRLRRRGPSGRPRASPARRWPAACAARLPQLAVPDELVAAVEADPNAGVDRACRLVADLRASGAFAGVHLIAGVRGPEVADRLAAMGFGSDPTAAHPATRPRPHLVPVPDPAA